MPDVQKVEVRQDDLLELLEAFEKWLHYEYFELGVVPTPKQCALIKRINMLSGRGVNLSGTWWRKCGYDIEVAVREEDLR